MIQRRTKNCYRQINLMALILSVETSTSVCSVALHREGKLIANLELHQDQAHASRLGPLIHEALACSGSTVSEINGIAVSSGPGSYTGLRIGTALIKGLCYALDVPMIGVSSLQILASKVAGINTTDAFLCPMIDARRMEVYCQIFNNIGEEQDSMMAAVIGEHSFKDYLHEKAVIFFGNGALKCKSVIVHKNALFLPNITPSAVELGYLAYKKFERADFENLDQFSPFYLKEFLVKNALEI